MEITRCDWCGTDPLYVDYHDKVWGVPEYNDTNLFKMLTLEGAQAGLSWITVLRKQDSYISAFDNFNVEKIAGYGKKKINQLLQNDGIIRNKLKINSTITNARACIAIVEEFGSFAEYIWQFVDGIPVKNKWRTLKQVPSKTILAETISKDLKQRSFKFVGPTIVYAYMQAIGMVNDHLVTCYKY